MKWLVIGAGSIGTQHLALLKEAGEHEIQVVEPHLERRKAAWEYAGKKQVHGAVEDAGAFDVGLVCTPTHLHYAHAVWVAERAPAVIIEKPVAHSAPPDTRLLDAVQSKVGIVACPYRFHPGFQRLKQIVDQRELGPVFYAQMYYRQRLTEWRPGTDWRESYSAKRETGGGLFLDRIHEADAARALFGEPSQLRASYGHYDNTLDTEVEHVAFCLSLHPGQNGNVMVTVDLDCITPGYHCGIKLVGPKGMASWFYAPLVNGTPDWSGHAQGVRAQLKHWIACCYGDEEPVQSVADGYKVLQTALASYASAEQGQWVTFAAKPDIAPVVAEATSTASLAA